MEDRDKKPAAKDESGLDKADTLSLSIMPLSSPSLKAAKLVKNTRMETMVELHSDASSGSLQIRPEEVAANFPGSSTEDQAMISKLATLNSFDIYSLRSGLHKLGIEVDQTALELSPAMKERLDKYSMEFIRPLIANIFGDGKTDLKGKDSLQKILRDPDVARAQERLKTMSVKIGIPVASIPAFLQDYRDLFLSTIYYRENLEDVVPSINRFWIWLADLKTQREVTASPAALASCRRVMGALRFLSTSTRERLTKFRGGFDMFWSDMSTASFVRLRKEIEDNHASMGAVLCGLTVKMRDWSNNFPDNETGGPTTRMKYVMTELEPGLSQLIDMENSARMSIGMKPLSGV